MSERDNALSQGVLVPYTETRRDDLERELAEEANKLEINRRSSNGITVVAYWLMRENVTTIFVHDARVNGSTEFEVPLDSVMENFYHPFANKDCAMGSYSQGENGSGYGA